MKLFYIETAEGDAFLVPAKSEAEAEEKLRAEVKNLNEVVEVFEVTFKENVTQIRFAR